MAVTGKWFPKGVVGLLNGSIDLDTDNIRVSLHTNAAGSPTYATDQYLSDIGSEVANGNGYTTGGQTLTTPAVSSSGTVVSFDTDDAQWANSTISAYYAAVYMNTGAGDSSSWPLIAWIDFGATVSSSNGTFTIAWSTGGIGQIDVT